MRHDDDDVEEREGRWKGGREGGRKGGRKGLVNTIRSKPKSRRGREGGREGGEKGLISTTDLTTPHGQGCC